MLMHAFFELESSYNSVKNLKEHTAVWQCCWGAVSVTQVQQHQHLMRHSRFVHSGELVVSQLVCLQGGARHDISITRSSDRQSRRRDADHNIVVNSRRLKSVPWQCMASACWPVTVMTLNEVRSAIHAHANANYY